MRTQPAEPVVQPYWWWFDVAKMTRQNRPERYRDGVEREAALAAIDEQSRSGSFNNICEAVEGAFSRARIGCSAWDGSIA